jgi:hypothetical protein
MEKIKSIIMDSKLFIMLSIMTPLALYFLMEDSSIINLFIVLMSIAHLGLKYFTEPWVREYNNVGPFESIQVWFDNHVPILSDAEVLEPIKKAIRAFDDVYPIHESDMHCILFIKYDSDHQIPNSFKVLYSSSDEFKLRLQMAVCTALCEELFPNNDEYLDQEFMRNTGLF